MRYECTQKWHLQVKEKTIISNDETIQASEHVARNSGDTDDCIVFLIPNPLKPLAFVKIL